MKYFYALLGSALLVALFVSISSSPKAPSQQSLAATRAISQANISNSSPAHFAAHATQAASSEERDFGFKSWLRIWQTAGSNSMDIEEGRRLAISRHEAMAGWIIENPALAMKESLSWSEWATLPPSLKTLVEQPFSQKVDLEVLANCPGAEKIHRFHVTLNGERHDAYLFGSKESITTKEALPARGFLLDGKVVLAESQFERLDGADLAAARQLFPAAKFEGSTAPRSGVAENTPRTILWGGTLYDLASEQDEADLTRLLDSTEKSFNPHSIAMAYSAGVAATGTNNTFRLSAATSDISASSTWTETPKKALGLRINYADGTAYSFTPSELTNLVNSASNAVKVMSYGKTWLLPRIVSITLPKTYQEYQDGGPDLIVNDSRTVLTGMGINRDSYDFVIHAHPQMNFSYAGLGVVGGANNWINGHVSVEVLTHEIGHNYGLGHSHYWANFTGLGSLGHTQSDGSLMEREEYGDPFDIMGGSTLPAGQYNAHGKAALNWIEPKEVINVVTNGIYRVFRYDHPDARTNAGTKLALKIVCPGGEEYWVSHRKLFTAVPSLFKGANIVRADGTADQSVADATPLSKPLSSFSTDRGDGGLAVGKSFTDSLDTVRITTIASGGTAPLEYIDVQVTFLDDGAFSFFTGADLQTNGLVGSYINRNLETRSVQDDWRKASGIVVAGKRVDRKLSFTSDGWGARAPLHLTGGTDANWDNFSVQWDGTVVVRRPVRLATVSDDSSRFWIDLDDNGTFGTTAPELVNNHWGTPQGATRGDLSPVIPPGTYAIRIQYEEGNGGNYFSMTGAELPFELFTSADASTPGLMASFVASDLRTYTVQNDWRTSQSIAGSRVDDYPGSTITSWGTLDSVGLVAGLNGTDADWDNYSVQWDGYLKVSTPIRMATVSDDQSRMWIDLNTNGAFGASAPELVNNGWGGGGQGMTLGQVSAIIQPGLYPIRIQYEEGAGGNGFLLAGVTQVPADAPSLVTGALFTGTDNRVLQITNSNDYTVQFWFRSTQVDGGTNSWSDGMGIVDANGSVGGNGYGISLGHGEILFGSALASPVTIHSGFLADGLWHYVVARRQADGAISLFVDGIPIANAFASNGNLEGIISLTVGSLEGGRQYYIGNVDQLRIWQAARSDEQIASDYYLSRGGHGYVETPPTTRILQLQPNSVQVFWDALSSYRILEGASAVNGPYTPLLTDQNSTNISIANPIRFFRVRK